MNLNQAVVNIPTSLTTKTSTWAELFTSSGGSAVSGGTSNTDRYRFTVTVTNTAAQLNGGATAPAAATLDVYVTNLAVVPLSIGAPNLPRFNPGDRLSLTASPLNPNVSFPSDAAFQWRCTSDDCAGLNLSDPRVTTTGATSRSLVLDNNILKPSKVYTFVFTVVADFLGFASASIRTTSQPTSGSCASFPPTGMALLQDFELRCDGWTDEAGVLPLEYAFEAVSDSGLPVTLRASAAASSVTLVLPNPEGDAAAANVTIRARIRNSAGAETSAVVQLVVSLASVLSNSSSAASTDPQRSAKNVRASLFSAVKEVDGALPPSPAGDLQSLQSVRYVTDDATQLGTAVRGPASQFLLDKMGAYADVLNRAGEAREGATDSVVVGGTAVKVEVQQVAQLPAAFVPTALAVIVNVGTSMAGEVSPDTPKEVAQEAESVRSVVSSLCSACVLQISDSSGQC